MGGYADAKLRFGGLRLRGRARGSQPCLNMVEFCPNSLQVTSGPYPKKSQKEGVQEDTWMLKSASGDCTSEIGLEGVNLPKIWWNFAQSDCK